MKTLVLLSGGLDSAVVLAACLDNGDTCEAIAFDYKQPHRIELEYAEALADHYNVPFTIVSIPVLFRTDDVVFAGRNLIFASIAIASAQISEYDRIAVGCNATDWERFPDCRPPFWRALRTCAEAYRVRVETPLIYYSKRDVVDAARRLSVPIELTWSCYSPQDEKPCGECLACKTRNGAIECLTPA